MIKWLLPVIVASLLSQVEAAFGQTNKPVAPDSSVQAFPKPPRDEWLGKDKFDHAMASAGLVAAQFYLFHQEFDWKTSKSRQIAASSALVIGIAKEIYDKTSRRGTPSWKDVFADLVGIAVAVAVFTK